jgi:hypothetical protein
MFVFGVDADDVPGLRKERKNLKTDPRFDELMKDIEDGMFGDKDYFKPLVDSISNMKVGRWGLGWEWAENRQGCAGWFRERKLVSTAEHTDADPPAARRPPTAAAARQVGNDWFLVANDFADYLRAQEDVDKVGGAWWWWWGGLIGGREREREERGLLQRRRQVEPPAADRPTAPPPAPPP